MMKVSLKIVPILICTVLFSVYAFKQSDVPWDITQLVYPADLVKTLNDPAAKKPAIICVGAVDLIKGAVKTEHAASTLAGIEDLKYILSKYGKDKEIIIYCGCCKLKTCPNIKPAFEYAIEVGYKNAKVLYLPKNLSEDWTELGYPMEPTK